MKLVTALCRAVMIAMLWTSMQCATAAAREAFAQYAGILPCADCAALRVQVLWRSEKRFVGAPLAITESDANGAVVLNAGQELVVRLSSNPTTGYRWTLATDADAVLALAATPKYQRDRVAEGMVGTGG